MQMKANVSAKGFTNVILVLNMKRFVREEDRDRFERIRGREEFAQALREDWPKKLAAQRHFITLEEDKRRYGRPDKMSTEQVGFAIGVFRSLMLEKYTFPAYALDKEKVDFPHELMTNFQFKKLFWKQWGKWNIYVRPTNTGFFIIRLTNRYPQQARSFIKLAQDIVQLQESLDVRSAQKWLHDTREKYANEPDILAPKEQSVQAFFDWLGVEEDYDGDVFYYPVQWRIAMEACSLFVKTIGSEIAIAGEAPIHLEAPQPSISIPLHDSYVVHHFIEVLATAALVKKAQHKHPNSNSQIPIELNNIRESPQIRQALANLCEGAILKTGALEDNLETLTEQASSFPKHGWKIVDEILQGNQATWIDELCLMNSKTAILWPSKKWHEHELLVSSVPGSTLQVVYRRYWDAIERMIEFGVEIRVMAQLIESASYDILVEISEKIYQTQSKLFGGDIIMNESLPELVAKAASLRHQAALCQSLSHPQLWIRADFAMSKADYLLRQLGVPTILQHVERNIDSIVEFVNHIDELYLADLSEKSNENDTRMSMILAAASLTLTILILPSFWADISQVIGPPFSRVQDFYRRILPTMEILGDVLAAILILAALLLLRLAMSQGKKRRGLLRILGERPSGQRMLSLFRKQAP
jgi:hypothetical protein